MAATTISFSFREDYAEDAMEGFLARYPNVEIDNIASGELKYSSYEWMNEVARRMLQEAITEGQAILGGQAAAAAVPGDAVQTTTILGE